MQSIVLFFCLLLIFLSPSHFLVVGEEKNLLVLCHSKLSLVLSFKNSFKYCSLSWGRNIFRLSACSIFFLPPLPSEFPRRWVGALEEIIALCRHRVEGRAGACGFSGLQGNLLPTGLPGLCTLWCWGPLLVNLTPLLLAQRKHVRSQGLASSY